MGPVEIIAIVLAVALVAFTIVWNVRKFRRREYCSGCSSRKSGCSGCPFSSAVPQQEKQP